MDAPLAFLVTISSILKKKVYLFLLSHIVDIPVGW